MSAAATGSVALFVLLNAAAVITAVLTARATTGGIRGSRGVLAALCGYLLLVHSVILAPGLVGWLSVGGVATLVGVALAGAWWWARRSQRETTARDERPRFTPVALLPPLTALVAGGVWAWPHVAHATRLWIWDDYTYHMVYPALWLREGVIAAVAPAHAFTMQAWYPLSASVVSTWFMLPFVGSRGDALAWVSLTGLLYAGIVVSGAAELLARLGCRPGAWAVPVVLFVTSDRVDVMASSFSDADLGQAAALFAAFAFAVPRGEGERPEDLRVDAWYAALLSGLAVGVKVSAAPTALVVLLLLAWRAGARWRGLARMALLFAAAFVTTGGYWYARNAIHTGNPLYPAAFLFWPGTTFPQTTLHEYAQHYGLGRAVSDALAVYANWPRAHAALAVIGLAGMAAWMTARRAEMTRTQRSFAYGLLAIVAVTLLLLPGTPYSAGNAMTFITGIVHWDSMRYVALLPILGWVALGFLIGGGAGAPAWRTVLAFAVAVAALLASTWAWATAALVVATAGVVSLLLARLGAPIPRARVAVTTGVAAIVVVLVAGWHAAKADATAAALYREPLFGAAMAVLDRQPAGTRVAIFGDQWIYPTFGARHHLIPVRLDGNGRVATAPIGGAMAPAAVRVDPWTFRSNLAASSIDIVAVVHLPHPGRSLEWPSQAAALEATRAARLLYRDRAVGIWKLSD